MRRGGVLLAALGAVALAAGAASGQTRPTKPQAAAAVAVYRQAREQCAQPGPACEEAAKRRFVETMNCVVQGQRGVDPATLDQQFTAYVDLVSEALGAPDAAPSGPAGPCFTAAASPSAPVAPAVSQPPGGAAPADASGPSAEALRRFRKQAEEQSRPVTPTQGGSDVGDHEKLKSELEAMKGRLKSGAVGGPAAPAPAPFGAPAPLPAPTAVAPAPSGTTTIQGGPTPPGTTTIQGGPTAPPAATGVTPYKYTFPGGVSPSTIRPTNPTLNLQPVPAVRCPSGQYACRRRVTEPGTCVPDGTICN